MTTNWFDDTRSPGNRPEITARELAAQAVSDHVEQTACAVLAEINPDTGAWTPEMIAAARRAVLQAMAAAATPASRKPQERPRRRPAPATARSRPTATAAQLAVRDAWAAQPLNELRRRAATLRPVLIARADRLDDPVALAECRNAQRIMSAGMEAVDGMYPALVAQARARQGRLGIGTRRREQAHVSRVVRREVARTLS